MLDFHTLDLHARAVQFMQLSRTCCNLENEARVFCCCAEWFKPTSLIFSNVRSTTMLSWCAFHTAFTLLSMDS